ncbi:type II toxin-antitoxin system VapC family toxin [Glycomyces dulcitolivorans]|uniref:type II toxin-antitoxin system VapC family toxin n=1 Tax=Glycomyces dulcitolivorans TaxID=2200759 RepID=UPI0018E52EA9|nr:type II toxin-antitoxin system VapC family toxin [Glycomyces dulcitolivorans]
MVVREARGIIDTCVYIDLAEIDPMDLPEIPQISAITMTELHQGVAMAKTATKRAARIEQLNSAIGDFDPISYDAEAASRFGTLATLVVEQGRSPKPRQMDLMIAAVASVHDLPLYTRNPDDFKGLESLVRVITV